MEQEAPSLVCQAEDCTAATEYACEAWVMTPPLRGYLAGEVYLCAEHTARLEAGEQLSVVTEPSNLDLVSVARWRDGKGPDGQG